MQIFFIYLQTLYAYLRYASKGESQELSSLDNYIHRYYMIKVTQFVCNLYAVFHLSFDCYWFEKFL